MCSRPERRSSCRRPTGSGRGSRVVLDVPRARLQDRLGRLEHARRVDGPDDRERGVAGAPAVAHLVEIVDADRRERLARARGSGTRADGRRRTATRTAAARCAAAPRPRGRARAARRVARDRDREIVGRAPARRAIASIAAGTSAGTTIASIDVCSRVVVAPTSPPSPSISRRALAPSRVRKIRCSCRCAPPRALPWREPTPTVRRIATTGPGRSSAATRRPASVRATTGTGQPGVVVRASSTMATYATFGLSCKSGTNYGSIGEMFRSGSCRDPLARSGSGSRFSGSWFSWPLSCRRSRFSWTGAGRMRCWTSARRY